VERDVDLGCARSITSEISDIVNRFGQIIVVEDDIATSPNFLRFMNEALELLPG
jgi:GR25 family glycosyltransferase involved in LPS biosynthesis